MAARLEDVDLRRIPEVGGKNASLGELIRELGSAGVKVPMGFALTADAFRLHLDRAKLSDSIYAELQRLDVRDVAELGRVASRIRESIARASLPDEVQREVLDAYARLSRLYEEEHTDDRLSRRTWPRPQGRRTVGRCSKNDSQ